jgi:5-methylcytosine-specific restriction endonuclease McrA
MVTTLLAAVAQLSNPALLAQVKCLAQREREATVALIAHLAELDARRLYLGEGYASLFTYCTQVLHLSEHAAYGRIEAARAVRRYPVLLEMLADGALTLTTLALLAPQLTPENHPELLDRARRQSKREVEALVAELRPQPPVPASVRRLPAPRPAAGNGAAPPPARPSLSQAPRPSPSRRLRGRRRWPPSRPRATACSSRRAPRRMRKLRLAQDLLRHQIPDGDVGQVLDRALTVLVERLTKTKLATTSRPRRRRRRLAPGSRAIPAEVKRVVWRRDGGPCAFVSRNGHRCTERRFLEFHHLIPYARGGQATVENIQLRCRAHNAYQAEQDFGPRPPWLVREPQGAYSVRTELRRRPPGEPGAFGEHLLPP